MKGAAQDASGIHSLMVDLDARLQLEAEKFRRAGKDPGSSFRGLFIDDAEASQLLAGLGEPNRSTFGAKATVHRQLIHLKELFCLSEKELWMLAAVVAPDFDLRYERIFAYLQDDITRKRPNVDLLLTLSSSSPDERIASRVLFSESATLIKGGLVTLHDETTDRTAPLLASSLQADERVVSYLLGSDEIDFRLRHFTRSLAGRPLDSTVSESTRKQMESLAGDWLTSDSTRLIVLNGSPGVGKTQAGQSVADRLGADLLYVDSVALLRADIPAALAMRLIFREATLRESALYWSAAHTLWEDGERPAVFLAAFTEQLALWNGVVILAGPADWPGPAVVGEAAAHRVSLPMPAVHERLALWKAELAGMGQIPPSVDEMLAHVSSGFRLTPGQIHDAVLVATSRAANTGEHAPSAQDLLAASRSVSSRALEAVADELLPRAGWADIVLPQDSIDQLRELCASVRCRGRVLDDWGFAARLAGGTGITALFVGPSGTGKTLAAGIVANELAFPIYRIDLARVVSKWIGETEKNLDRVFKAAEDSNAVLFLDEADALLGKRSEVKDSRDRYANLEISYLLQKMELYEGVAILATNMPQQLDTAFLRRLTFTVYFPLPEEAERLQIWHTLWPGALPRADDVNLRELAKFRLAGGNIKNILLAAAFLAASDGQEVTMQHLLHALRREYQKLGKEIDEEQPKP
jgi:AAA+ superfamily predicted ATPase